MNADNASEMLSLPIMPQKCYHCPLCLRNAIIAHYASEMLLLPIMPQKCFYCPLCLKMLSLPIMPQNAIIAHNASKCYHCPLCLKMLSMPQNAVIFISHFRYLLQFKKKFISHVHELGPTFYLFWFVDNCYNYSEQARFYAHVKWLQRNGQLCPA
jgi:Fe-S-cluster-containing hydrogenase component 2